MTFGQQGKKNQRDHPFTCLALSPSSAKGQCGSNDARIPSDVADLASMYTVFLVFLSMAWPHREVLFFFYPNEMG